MNQQAMPQLCRSGCGFYGSPATDGLCSQCFKQSLKKKNDPGRLSPPGVVSEIIEHLTSGAKMLEESESASKPVTELEPSLLPSTSVASSIAAASSSVPEHGGAAANLQAVTSTVTDKLKNELKPVASDASICSMQSNSGSEDMAGDDQKKKLRNRCEKCKKKVGLTGFECRCGGMYCGQHRYSDMHDCSFDYRAMGAAEIAKNNPVVAAEKVQKI